MFCLPNSGAFVIAWKRGIAILTAGNVKVSPDPRVSLVNGHYLQIENAVPQDGGEYVCQIATLEPIEISHLVDILGTYVNWDPFPPLCPCCCVKGWTNWAAAYSVCLLFDVNRGVNRKFDTIRSHKEHRQNRRTMQHFVG